MMLISTRAIRTIALCAFVSSFPAQAFLTSFLHHGSKKSCLFVKNINEDTTTTTDREKSDAILAEIASGSRIMPEWYYQDYEESEALMEEEDDDPDAIDPETLGKWDDTDLLDKLLPYEAYDDDSNGLDPNSLQHPDNEQFQHLVPSAHRHDDEEEDPMLANSNPFDERTVLNPLDSYMVDDATRDDSVLEPLFPNETDVEKGYNQNITFLRKNMDGMIETYVDPYLKKEVPRHVAIWHGYPEPMNYPPKANPLENYFTTLERKTNFDTMTPFQARKTAVQYARAKNNEWLPVGVSQAFHAKQTQQFRLLGLRVGTLMKGPIDEEIRQKIQVGVLNVLGNAVDLLEIYMNGTASVFRFHYHGLIKNKAGMAAWTETLIQECGVNCTGVVFETAWRKRDPYYDGGDKWFGPY